MTPAERDIIKDCNGLGDMGNDNWGPYRRDGEKYYTASGLRALPPLKWRPATLDEIVAEMDSRGEVPLRIGAINVPSS